MSGNSKTGMVLTSAAVGAGPCACPNEGNHRGLPPTIESPPKKTGDSDLSVIDVEGLETDLNRRDLPIGATLVPALQS